MARITFLDAVRAPLAWSVVVIHVLYFSGYAVGSVGPYVVNTFIVLSGFVITKLLVERREPYGVFMVRRLCRLMPVYWICLGLAIAVRPWTLGSFGPELDREVHEQAQWGWHLLAHVTMLHGAIPEIWLPEASYTFLPPAWAVSVELQLYLVAPLVAWLLVREGAGRGKLPLTVAFGSLIVLMTPIHWRLYSWWDHMGGFVVQKLYLFLAGGLVWWYWPHIVPQWRAPRWIVWLGEMSYSTYLVHFPVLMVINAWLDRRIGQPERALIMFECGAPVIVGLSALLYYRVELPGVELGKVLTRVKQK